jgi:hypothetical protein
MATSLLLDGVSDLWVVSCYYNAHGDQSRRRNCIEFAKNMRRQNVPVLMVELCHTESEPGMDPLLFEQYLRVQHADELWCKEALLNIGIKALPKTCTKVCWIDADILFLDNWWAARCSELLDQHKVIQPFDAYAVLSAAESKHPLKHRSKDQYLPSFAYTARFNPKNLDFIRRAHPGYAWGARREVLEKIGGLYPNAILGLADVVMAYGFACKTEASIAKTWTFTDVRIFMGDWNQQMVDDCVQWQRRAVQEVRSDIATPNCGVAVHHMYHGDMDGRQYNKIGEKLKGFDPKRHVAVSSDGLLHWTPTCPKHLKTNVSNYFQRRSALSAMK